MLCKEKYCAKFNKYSLPRDNKKIGLSSGLLLAILPKCPFCFMAFSSTVVLCGEAGTFTATDTHSSLTTFLLSVLFCGITLVSMLLNYHNNRTKFAMLLALAGSSFILFSVTKGGGFALYYCGVAVIFFAVWLNGSVRSFFGKIRTLFSKNTTNKIAQFQ